mmetsp:Transcript_6965/g.17862  ORF Transcript_6965/g.17862 Transcript_6965/m.17862 type:complete len:257 (+) Transcript_6965:487-1257(+)
MVDAQEGGYVLVVGQGGGEADDADHALAGLDLAQRARHQHLDHSAAVVIEQVHLVNDEQPHKRGHGHVSALSRDDVPLLRCGHDHLRLLQLLLGQLHVPGELLDNEPQRRKALGEGARHLRGQRLHGRHVHDLEVCFLNDPVLHVLAYLSQHSYHRNVGLASASGSTHQHVLVAVEAGLVDGGLDAVERLVARKRLLSKRLHLLDLDERHLGRLGFGGRHAYLFIALETLACGAFRKRPPSLCPQRKLGAANVKRR